MYHTRNRDYNICMKKIIAIVVSAVSLSVIVFVFINSQNNPDKTGEKNVKQPSFSLVQESLKLKEYTDPSGFKFSYTDNVVVNKKSVKDDNTYTLLELKSSLNAGKITLEATGSNLTSLDKWTSKHKTASHEAQKLKIADMNAVELSSKTSMITGALDKGVLFMITTEFSDRPDFWKSLYKKIVSSFAFTPPEATSGSFDTSASPPSNDDISFEGEEVIE